MLAEPKPSSRLAKVLEIYGMMKLVNLIVKLFVKFKIKYGQVKFAWQKSVMNAKQEAIYGAMEFADPVRKNQPLFKKRKTII